MLKKFAAVLIAASLVSAPVLAAGNGAIAAPATKSGLTANAKVTKTVVKVKRAHVRHGKRHIVVKRIKRVKMMKHARHISRTHVAKISTAGHGVKIVKKVTR